jgi:hypothetical protein
MTAGGAGAPAGAWAEIANFTKAVPVAPADLRAANDPDWAGLLA